jgi:D-glycero-D-manno-heptose 1,7-bisphosphate phosphatase
MMHDIAYRYGVDLAQVPMVGDTLRDLQAAQAAGCEPHLVRSGRAAALDAGQVVNMIEQVPGTFVHRDLGELATHLLERAHVHDSQSGGL